MQTALRSSNEQQALKERQLRESAERDRIEALEKAHQEREAKLLADLEEAKEA